MTKTSFKTALRLFLVMSLAVGLIFIVIAPIAANNFASTGGQAGDTQGPGVPSASSVLPGLQETSNPEANLPAAQLDAEAILNVVKSAETQSSVDGSTISNGEWITYTVQITNLTASPITISIVNDELVPVTFFDVECVSGPNCTLVQTIINTEREISTIKSEDPFTIPIAITVTTAVTWGNIPLSGGDHVTLQFAARVDCRLDGAIIQNSADVIFGASPPYDGSSATSNQTDTQVKFVPVPDSATGNPILLGPTGCTEETGAYDQDWGDYDRDGDLDMALGTVEETTIYRNNNGTLSPIKVFPNRRTFGVRWANTDDDEGLELIAVGESASSLNTVAGINYIYDPDANFAETVFQTKEVLWRVDMADFDADGQFEMVGASYIDSSAANDYRPCRLRAYDYVGGNFIPDECLIGPLSRDNNPLFFPTGDDDTYSLVWGNTTDTPFLDLIEGNYGTFDRRYVNNGFVLSSIGNGIDFENDDTTSVDLGDFDNDGDLDLAVGNYGQSNLLYRRDQLDPPIWTSAWAPAQVFSTNVVAWNNPALSKDRSQPVRDDYGLTYDLPFVFPFGQDSRSIRRIHVNTNGLIELLEEGESCLECNSYDTYRDGDHTNKIDAIFAANSDLMTGFIIEALPDRVEITWMGSTYYTPDFAVHPMQFKAILYSGGNIEWKFFDLQPDRPIYSGVYDVVANQEYMINPHPVGTNLWQTYRYQHSLPAIPTLVAGPDPNLSSIATTDNANITYALPGTFNYFTRTLESISVNTNGLIEPLEAGDSCVACADSDTHTKAYSSTIDAIYAFNSNLKTGVMIEYSTTPTDHVLITWMGTTNNDNNFLGRGLAYSVRLYRDGNVLWKFFDMNFASASGDHFSGLFDEANQNEYVVPGYENLVGTQLYKTFEFRKAIPELVPINPPEIVLAVGTTGKNYVYTSTGTSLQSVGQDISQDVYTTTSLAWGDYNGDGQLDLAVGNENGPNQIFQGDAAESTSLDSIAVWTSVEADATRSVAWGDYDLDGDLDLAVGNTMSQANRIYRNDGSNIFNLAWTSVETDNTWSVAWGDYDLDGDPDLAVGNYGEPNRIYPNENGQILTQTVWTSIDAANTRTMAWADFDLDGDQDLVVGNNGTNQLFINRLKFKTGGINSVVKDLGVVNDITWGDWNNDGLLDLAMGGSDLETPGGGYVNVIENQANQIELIEANLVRAGQDDEFEVFDIAWGDYNRDGHLDLAASFPRTRQVRLFRNNGEGLAWTPDLILDNVKAYAIDWADVQADGWPDLVMADSADTSSPQVKVYLNNNGSFNFATPAGYVASPLLVPGVVVNVRAIDRDNDGDLDLSMANLGEQSQQLTTFGSFLNPELTPVSSFKSNSVAWGDHDGDGFQDLLFGGSGSGVSTELYHNQDGASFCRAGEPGCPVSDLGFSSGGRRQAIFGDVDSDGKLDIADGVPGGSVRLFLSNDESSSIRDGDAEALAWGDVDGDGLLDLLIGGSQDFESPDQIFINQGFSPYIGVTANWSTLETEHTASLAWADYNDDNHLDFAVGICNINNGAVQLYRNTGDSTSFDLVTNTGLPTSAPNCISSLAWADYDGDGDYDLAVGIDGERSYLYAYDQNLGTFTQTWQSSLDRNTTSLAWGDWNNDGKPDLAIGNKGQSDQVYANFSSSDDTVLLLLWESEDQLNTTGVAWGDKDDDGDLELAVSQDGTASSGYYENGYANPAHLGSSGFAKYMPVPSSPPYLSIPRPGTNDAYLISSPALEDTVLTMTFTVFDPNGSRKNGTNFKGDEIMVDKTVYEYSVNGGDIWLPATVSGTVSITPTTFRQGQVNTIPWDVESDGIVGDNILFRITVVSDRTIGPIQRTTSRAVSPPFRVRGGLTCSWPANAGLVPSINGITPTYTTAAGSALRFDGLVSLIGPRDTVLTYTWDFGDESALTVGPPFTTHTYTRSNQVFTVTLTIVGEPCPEVREAVATTMITVGNILSGDSVYLPIITFNGSGTLAVDGFKIDPNVPVPAQLTGVHGQSQADGSTVYWNPGHPDDNILEYRIYRRPRTAIGPFKFIGTAPGSATSYLDTAASCGHMYYVTAFNAGGESLPSTSVFVSQVCR